MTLRITPNLRGRALYLDTVADIRTSEQWAQKMWRGLLDENGEPVYMVRRKAEQLVADRCGTAMCFAGHAAVKAGGRWLVDFTDNGPCIDGEPIDFKEMLSEDLHEMMLAETDDDPQWVVTRRGRRVIHVAFRALRVLELELETDEPDDDIDFNRAFNGGNTLEQIEGLADELYENAQI